MVYTKQMLQLYNKGLNPLIAKPAATIIDCSATSEFKSFEFFFQIYSQSPW